MSRAEGRSNELHDRPRPLTGGVCYATRTPARPLRAGDRVRDLLATDATFRNARTASAQPNYPGAYAFGTVIQTGTFRPLHVQVRFDDGFECRVAVTDLQRL